MLKLPKSNGVPKKIMPFRIVQSGMCQTSDCGGISCSNCILHEGNLPEFKKWIKTQSIDNIYERSALRHQEIE